MRIYVGRRRRAELGTILLFGIVAGGLVGGLVSLAFGTGAGQAVAVPVAVVAWVVAGLGVLAERYERGRARWLAMKAAVRGTHQRRS